MTEVNKNFKRLEEVLKPNSETEDRQEIVPVEIAEIDSANSDDKAADIQSHIKSLPDGSKISIAMKRTSELLMSSPFSVRLDKEKTCRTTILGVPIYTTFDDKIKMNYNVLEFTDEIHKTLSSAGYTERRMHKDTFFNSTQSYKCYRVYRKWR